MLSWKPLPRMCVSTLMPRVFAIALDGSQQFTDRPQFNVTHTYPHGSVYINAVELQPGMPIDINITVTVWGTREYLDSVDVRGSHDHYGFSCRCCPCRLIALLRIAIRIGFLVRVPVQPQLLQKALVTDGPAHTISISLNPQDGVAAW